MATYVFVSEEEWKYWSVISWISYVNIIFKQTPLLPPWS